MAKDYARGDEVTIGGRTAVVTGTGSNNGNAEYTIAFQDEDGRPISVGQQVAPQARANGQAETLALNAEREEEAVKEGEEATKEAEENKDDSEVDGTDSPKEVREKTVTPDPAKTPATNSVPAKAGTTTAKR